MKILVEKYDRFKIHCVPQKIYLNTFFKALRFFSKSYVKKVNGICCSQYYVIYKYCAWCKSKLDIDIDEKSEKILKPCTGAVTNS